MLKIHGRYVYVCRRAASVLVLVLVLGSDKYHPSVEFILGQIIAKLGQTSFDLIGSN